MRLTDDVCNRALPTSGADVGGGRCRLTADSGHERYTSVWNKTRPGVGKLMGLGEGALNEADHMEDVLADVDANTAVDVGGLLGCG